MIGVTFRIEVARGWRYFHFQIAANRRCNDKTVKTKGDMGLPYPLKKDAASGLAVSSEEGKAIPWAKDDPT